MNWVSASIAPASQSTISRFTALKFTASRVTASRLTTIGSVTSRSTASKYSFNLVRSWPPSVSPNTLNYGCQVHLWVHSIPASKCISILAQWRSPSPSLSSLDLSVFMCTSNLARSRPPSASLGSLDLSLLVHLQTRSIMELKYIFQERWRMYGDTGVTMVDRVTGSIYSVIPGVDRHHLLFISSYHKMKIQSVFPNFWSHSLCPRFRASTQLRGSSTPGCMISSHPITTLLEPEPLFLLNSLWMLNECVQVLLQSCSSTICGQIDRMYIYRDIQIMHAILRCSKSCDCNNDEYDIMKCLVVM